VQAHPAQPGIHALQVGGGVLYVPPGYRPEQAAPLIVMLHGAGGQAKPSLDVLRPAADRDGLLLLAPQSRGSTWDAIRGDFGPDAKQIDRDLAEVFSRYSVDPARVAIAGFSDGASYALSLGLSNGELFKAIVAFSPGFIPPNDFRGKPRVYVSHGTRDDVLPIDLCSRALVPRLRSRGYAVAYREFDGPHAVPQEIVGEAVRWLLGA
jgi:phospholipase/carboxylesterase